MLTQNILFFIFSVFFLVISGIFLVKALEKIAKFIGLSEFAAAFILMAFATSLPELLVGINSSLQGNPALSLGNVIGANIINLTLITGIFVLLGRGIKTDKKKMGKSMYFMFLSIILLVVLYLIGNSLSRIDGVILLSLFFINAYVTFKESRKYSAKFNTLKSKPSEKVKYILLFLISLIVLFVSSGFVVEYAHNIAVDLELSEIIVGLFLISIATTLPEFAFGLNAILLKHEEMSIGNQAGTIFTNIAAVIGLVAIIHPITVSLTPFLISGAFMFLSAVIFLAFMNSENRFQIIEGVSLIILYLVFVIIQFFVR